jgi:guanylate kinase
MSNNKHPDGLMLVISSPSGAGKTTLARGLLAADPDIRMSVSVTTRKPRHGEVEAEDYFFIEKEQFHALRAADELLEWAEVFGNYYGTPRKPVDDILQAGCDVLFDMDWQGARQMRENSSHDLVRIFILPPSLEALERRLIERGKDDPDTIAKRMAEAAEHISHQHEYDYIIINADIDESLAQLKAIVTAERLRVRPART